MKNESKVTQAIRKFFSTTTLHGFKYLFSDFVIDRVGWLICCCLSTFCAGLLCAVLWARFLEVPVILELSDLQSEETAFQHMPLVAICPPVDKSASLIADRLTTNATMAETFKKTLFQVLSAYPTAIPRLEELEILLSEKNISLGELVFDYIPSCELLMPKCRWQQRMMPCDTLFKKELTQWGICCMMRPVQVLHAIVQPKATRFLTSKGLDLVLQCSVGSTGSGCRFYSTFEVNENVEPMIVFPGNNYFARLRFTSVPQNSADELIERECNSDVDNDMVKCLARCSETLCGCANPINNPRMNSAQSTLPPCTLAQLECLRVNQNTSLCSNCLPPCNKITTYVTLEEGRMAVVNHVIDPLYSGLNVSSAVLHLRVYISLSRIFNMNPTETWLSLLSSLGGMFNMFLGVGLFSALEILFLLIVKLPIAFKNSSEIINSHPSRY